MFLHGSLPTTPELFSDLFQQIIDHTSSVIYVKDLQFRYLHVNQQYECFSRLKRCAILGNTDFELFPVEMARGFRANDERVLRTGEPVRCEEVAPHSDGPHTYLSVKFPLRDESGEIVAVAGISTDITDRKLARQEIDSLRRHYTSLMDSVGDGVCGLDVEGRVTFVNHAMERLLGFSEEELLGQCRSTFFADRILKGRECPIAAVLNGGEPRQVPDARFRCRDGTHLPVEYMATPLREGEVILGAVIAFRDVRVRIELKQSVEEMQAARVVQMALYPKSDPVLPGFEISGVMHPSSHTSGDYFDYIPTADGALAVVVGDVSGHGLGPALEMVETRASLRTLLSDHSDLNHVFNRLNAILQGDLPEGMFVTLFMAKIDPQRRVMNIAAAGHQAQMLTRGGEVVRLDSMGLPLGIQAGGCFESPREFALQPGDLIVLATDGIMEQMPPDPAPGVRGELFGWQGAMASVRRNRDLPAKQILERLCEDLRQFAHGGPQKDDVTAVIIKVL